jgi:hypothetical protein
MMQGDVWLQRGLVSEQAAEVASREGRFFLAPRNPAAPVSHLPVRLQLQAESDGGMHPGWWASCTVRASVCTARAR